MGRISVTLLVCLILTVLGALALVPFSSPMPGFWSDAQQFAETGHITSTFTPCGYPALLGLGLRVGGVGAATAIQCAIYLAILLAVYSALRVLLLSRSAALAGACLVGFYPDVVITIRRVWDTNVTAALLMSICAMLLLILRRGLTPTRAILVGLLWGLSINVRPNFPALILPIAFAFWIAEPAGSRLKTLISNAALTLGSAAVVIGSVATIVHGSFYMPGNGPYNLYAGTNAFTESALLENLNAEPSIYPSLRAEGFPADVDVYNPALRPHYVQAAFGYLRAHPFLEVRLFAVKFITLLRPDTKIHPLGTFEGAIKVVEALAVPCWLVALLLSRRGGWGKEDWLFLTFVVAYMAPYLITNSDPRFRVPLDVLALTHAIYRVSKLSPVSLPSRVGGGLSQGRLARVAN